MEIRLNKYLSEAGVCSRREADTLIAAGKVTVDGQIATMGMKVTPNQDIRVGKKQIGGKKDMVLLAVNKPVGIVCTEEKKEKHNIICHISKKINISHTYIVKPNLHSTWSNFCINIVNCNS